ncbi:MAG: imidazoleglycerol-phosphate dehydratase HisB, partial [Oscillospiraceae bacterium]|nr:imidazoleglycerol-phosphate dehydratase HisB [Oscillospiraceae bacterium]
NTGCGFLDHMLELFCRHGSFDLTVECHGDTQVDDHHTVEDVGIVLGKAFAQALGEMRGITRYGSFILPMDEVLMICAVDLSGRAHLGWQVEIPTEKVGTFDTQLGKEFWLAFVRSCPGAVHLKQLAGENSHHILEAVFKGMGRALRQAVAIEPGRENEIPSTKGLLV